MESNSVIIIFKEMSKINNLNFKIITYKTINYKILESEHYYSNDYDDRTRLKAILNEIAKKYDKESQTHRVIICNFKNILWDKYFNNINCENGLIDERSIDNYYDYKIGDLCKQFDVENTTLKVLVNPPFGDGVGRAKGIHYFFHTNEKDIHHIPHIHVKSGDIEFRINLQTLQIIDNKTFKNPKKTKEAVLMVKNNQKELLNYWEKVVIKGEKIKFKMFLPC